MFSTAETDINPAYLGNRMKRFLAFCIDIFPIYILVTMIYRRFSEYDTVMETLMADPNNLELQAALTPIMNTIGMFTGILYLFYCFIMEASVHQATYGKKLMKLKVISKDGFLISPKVAFWRNAFKVISNGIFSAGFFWILFDKQKRGWHDIMGKTFVVDSDYEVEADIPEALMEQLEEIKDQPYRNTSATVSDSNFNSLKEGNQSNLLYYPDLDLKDFELMKYEIPNFKHRLLNYKRILVEDVLYKNTDIPGHLLWNNNTYGQKLLRVVASFDNHVESDGVYAFLFHNSEFTFAMIDVLQTIGAEKMLSDYMVVVREFGEQMEVFSENRKIFEYPLTSHKGKLEAFATAEASVSSTAIIDEYYNNRDFKQDFYQKVCNYVEANPHMFIQYNS